MTRNLRKAIKLREWTRVACDANDMEMVRELNKRADAAYLTLTPAEAREYRMRCFSGPEGAELSAWFYRLHGAC